MTSHKSSRPGKQALVIVGMHRSGTSATTGALRCLGVDLGARLYKGHKGINDKGYFEHNDIADTNDEVLATLGSSWDDILLKEDHWWHRKELAPYASKIQRYIRRDFANSRLWAVKDPRVCRLLPWWLDIFTTANVTTRFIFVVRSPEAVHRSLERRNGFSREKSYLLWSLHYMEAERWSRGFPRIFVDFDNFVENPAATFQNIGKTLELDYPIPLAQAAPCLEAFVTKDLRHHTNGEEPDESSPVIELAENVHSQLIEAARHGTEKLQLDRMDRLWERMEALQAQFPKILVEHIRSMGITRGGLQIMAIRVMRSWSWYTGKPVRFLERLIGRDV